MAKKLLLSCGILSSLLYIAMNIFIPMFFNGYDIASQTVSELSAIDAPSRWIWIPFAIGYVLLFACFGWGIRKAAGNNRCLHAVSVLVLIYAFVNIYWPPMHLRGNAPTITDTLHIAWAMMTLALMMLIMGFGAAALGRWFRIYTIITFAVFIVFGALVGRDAPGISANLPTPYIGIWERINIAAFMMWVIVFATILLNRQNEKRAHKTVPGIDPVCGQPVLP